MALRRAISTQKNAKRRRSEDASGSNPFERRVSKKKFDIVGQEKKLDQQNVGQARSKAHKIVSIDRSRSNPTISFLFMCCYVIFKSDVCLFVFLMCDLYYAERRHFVGGVRAKQEGKHVRRSTLRRRGCIFDSRRQSPASISKRKTGLIDWLSCKRETARINHPPIEVESRRLTNANTQQKQLIKKNVFSLDDEVHLTHKGRSLGLNSDDEDADDDAFLKRDDYEDDDDNGKK